MFIKNGILLLFLICSIDLVQDSKNVIISVTYFCMDLGTHKNANLIYLLLLRSVRHWCSILVSKLTKFRPKSQHAAAALTYDCCQVMDSIDFFHGYILGVNYLRSTEEVEFPAGFSHNSQRCWC
jgi:hypothetical protein